MADFDFMRRVREDDGRSWNDPEPFHRELSADATPLCANDGVVHHVGTTSADGEEDGLHLHAHGERLRIRDRGEDGVSIRLDAIDAMIEALVAIRDRRS